MDSFGSRGLGITWAEQGVVEGGGGMTGCGTGQGLLHSCPEAVVKEAAAGTRQLPGLWGGQRGTVGSRLVRSQRLVGLGGVMRTDWGQAECLVGRQWCAAGGAGSTAGG